MWLPEYDWADYDELDSDLDDDFGSGYTTLNIFGEDEDEDFWEEENEELEGMLYESSFEF